MRITKLLAAMATGWLVALNISTLWACCDDTIRLIHSFSADSPAHTGLLDLVPEIEAAADFSIRLEVYSTSDVGDGQDLVISILEGRYDFLLAPANLLAAKWVDVGPLNRTDLFESFDQWQRFLGSQAEQEVASLFQDSELQFVGSTWLASEHLISRRPIHRLEDIQGLRLQISTPTAEYENLLEALGANPVRIGWSEISPALHAGVVDGVVQPLAWADTGVFSEIFDTVVSNPVGSHVGLLMARNDWQDQLDSFTADRIQVALTEAMLGLGRVLNAQGEGELRELEHAGFNIAEFDAEEMMVYREAARDVWWNVLNARDQRIADLIDNLRSNL